MPRSKGIRAAARALREDGLKSCGKCREVKPLGEFHKASGRSGGLESHCKPCKSEYHRKPEQIEKKRQHKYVARYGITEAERDEMRRRQGNACAICGRVVERLHVDHCHESGAVRGLLCHACNVLLGNARDSADVLRAAIRYLERNRQ
jgi:hypothetical protein